MRLIGEFEGTYKGHNYLIRNIGYSDDVSSRFNCLGAMPNNWWCGYVELEGGDEYYNMEYLDIPISCHGGLTFKGIIHDKMYIGFDCNHFGDSPIIHGKSYCAVECEEIIDQLIERDNNNDDNN